MCVIDEGDEKRKSGGLEIQVYVVYKRGGT